MELIGNESTKSQIYIAMRSADERNRSVPHTLFSGAAGCGKTSMAKMVASWCATNFIPVPAESLTDYKSVLNLTEKLDDKNYDARGSAVGLLKPSVVFIDEIHNLPLHGQEILGMAMENFLLESRTSTRYIWLPYFTLIGATTDDGKLSKPFRDRFKLRFVFEPYKLGEAMEIVKTHAARLRMVIDARAVTEIAKRGRGVPRIIVGYLERARDRAIMSKNNVITLQIAETMFKELGVDDIGLTKTDLKILKTLYDAAEPIGLDNLAVIVNEAPKTLSSSVEPFLIQQELIIRGGRGRRITKKGVQYLGKSNYLSRKLGKVEIDFEYVRK